MLLEFNLAFVKLYSEQVYRKKSKSSCRYRKTVVLVKVHRAKKLEIYADGSFYSGVQRCTALCRCGNSITSAWQPKLKNDFKVQDKNFCPIKNLQPEQKQNKALLLIAPTSSRTCIKPNVVLNLR